MPRAWSSAAVALLLSALAAPVAAQHAVVLGGGGARGVTHAGAMVALEELGYRPSFVAGTSMGAIVGALYAAGYTVDEILDIVSGENWLRLMSPRAVPVGSNRDRRRPLVSFGVSTTRFQGGVLAAPGIDLRLIEMLFDAGVRARNDFDRLPLPYRAVAADLATGAEFVPAGGDLPRMVRASMAVPGAFAPVAWGDMVLVDGAVANNLPVSVARSLTNDSIIAVDVLTPGPEIEERGPLDVALRSLRLLIDNARPDVGSNPDILVRPRLEPGLTEAAFPASRADALRVARSGYDAVIAQVPPVTQQPESRRPPEPAPEQIGRLRIEGANEAEARLIRRIMRGTVGPYDPVRITAAVSSLYRTGLFQSVWPRVDFADGHDDPTLVIDARSVTRTGVSAAAHWNNDTQGAAWLSLRHGIALNTPVELHLAGTIDHFGQDASLDAAFFSAILPGLVWTGGMNAGERETRLIDDGEIIAQPRTHRAGGWVGAELRGALLGLNASVLVRSERIRTADLDEGWATGPYIRVARSPAPDRVVGVDPVLEVDLRAGDIEYQRARLQLSRSVLAGLDRVALLAALSVADINAPADAFPSLDRDLAPWLPQGAIGYSRMAVFGADAATPIPLNGHARVRLRVIARGDATSDLGDTDSWEFGGEAGAIWPTVLGPISIGAAVGRYGDWRLNVSAGPLF